MKLKVFHIRLSKEHVFADQEAINLFMEGVTVKKTSVELINGEINFWSIIVFYEEKQSENQFRPTSKISVTEESELTTEERQIYGTLKKWRQDKAIHLNVSSFIICHNTELMTLAKVRPRTLEELSNIKGFGGHKISTYGEEILLLLNSI